MGVRDGDARAPLTISVAAALGRLFTALIGVRWRLLAPGLRL